MGFQELCLLCYKTSGVRHSEAARVAQSPRVNPYYGRQKPTEHTTYQISPNSSLSDHLWPGSLVFFVQELVLDGMGLVQTARSTLAPTMAVTERKK